MLGEWPKRALGECATWLSGGTPRKSNPDFWNGSIPWISAKSLNDFRVGDSEDKVTNLAVGNGTRLVPRNSILFVVRGMSLKSEFRIGLTTREVTFNQDLKALIANEDVDAEFLAYAIRAKTTEILSLVEEAGHGTGVLPTARIQALEIGVPSKTIQERVVSFMKALDNKIALNRQINTTLESMAQALFKSWFVDFDPVIDNALAAGNAIPDALQKRAAARAARREALHQQTNKTTNKTANETTGATDAASVDQALPETGLSDQRLPSEIQQLFPDRFVLTEEMGWVPERWEAVRFSQLVDAKQGKYLAKTEMMESQNDVFQYPVWGGNGILGYSQKKSYDAPITLMTCRGSNCGLIKTTQSSSWISNNSFACKSRYGSEYFLYLYFISEDFSDCVSGSAQPQITYTALKNKLMKYPISTEICNVFSELVAVYREKQFLNDRQNELLTNLRDSLLPKLLSGQITIPDAEQQLAEVL